MYLVCVANFVLPAYSKEQAQGIITSIISNGIPMGVDKDGRQMVMQVKPEEADKAFKVLDMTKAVMDNKEFDFTKQTILRA